MKTTITVVVCKTSEGTELHATLVRLSRRQVVLELYDPHVVLQMSEVLSLKIVSGQQQLYSGRAVIRNLINTGTTMVCEATLDEISSSENSDSFASPATNFQQGFSDFL